MEKLDIPRGSARPGLDNPTEQHVGGLSHSPGARLYAGIVVGEDILGTSVPVPIIESVDLQCRKTMWSSNWEIKKLVVKS